MINSNLSLRLRLSPRQRNQLLALSKVLIALSFLYLAGGFCSAQSSNDFSHANLGFWLVCLAVGLFLWARHLAKQPPETFTTPTLWRQAEEVVPPTLDAEFAELECANKVREAPVTVLRMYELIILNLLIFGLSTSRPEIINWGANTRTAVLEGHEYYRMISAMFLHFDIVHLFLNMLALFAVGRVVEGYFGHARFLLIYLVGGLCGCIASLLFNLPNTYSVGASGAIFALFGAQLVLQSKYRDVVDFGNAGRNSLSTIALNLFYGLGTPEVDNWGHMGGLMGGLAVAMIGTQLFRFIRPHQYSPKLFTTETHPLVTRNLLLVTLGVTAVLSSTAVFSIFSHTITVDDITVTVPAGWQIVTDFEDVEYCKQGGVECLLGRYVTDDTWFEVIRLSSLGLALSTLETVDAAFASVIETQGAELVSCRSTQIDGREAVIRICDVENTRRMYVLIWDSGRLIRFYAEASRTTYENYRQDMESIATSIKFQAK